MQIDRANPTLYKDPTQPILKKLANEQCKKWQGSVTEYEPDIMNMLGDKAVSILLF